MYLISRIVMNRVGRCFHQRNNFENVLCVYLNRQIDTFRWSLYAGTMIVFVCICVLRTRLASTGAIVRLHLFVQGMLVTCVLVSCVNRRDEKHDNSL
jgi:hypothetical protein